MDGRVDSGWMDGWMGGRMLLVNASTQISGQFDGWIVMESKATFAVGK